MCGELGCPRETGFPSPRLQGGRSGLAWRAGEGQTVPSACPVLAPAAEVRQAELGTPLAQAGSRGQVVPGSQPMLSALGTPCSALLAIGNWGAGTLARQEQVVGRGWQAQWERVPDPTSLWKCSQA